MSIIVIIAAVIAAIGIGFMCGSIVNIRKTSEIERSNIKQNYQLEQHDNPTGIEIERSDIIQNYQLEQQDNPAGTTPDGSSD